LNGRSSRSSIPTVSYDEIIGSNELEPFGNQMWKELPN
jgi:carboxyl-terminal processing protease